MKNKNRNKFTQYILAVLLLCVLPAVLAACGAADVGAANSGSADLTQIEVGIEPTPPPNTLTYENHFYGFKFDYPDTYTLEEIDHGVILKKGTVTLRIRYKFDSEELDPFRTGIGAGDFIYEGKLDFMGQEVPVDALIYEMKIKAVFYGKFGITIDNRVFTISLEDLENDYNVVDISENIRTEAVEILESFEHIQATGSVQDVAQDSPSQPDNLLQLKPVDGWEIYKNQEYGFGFSYPNDMSIVEEQNLVKVQKGTLSLMISYEFADAQNQSQGGGSLAGDLSPAGGLSLLGEQVDIYVNTIDGQIKEVFFGLPHSKLGVQTDLRFSAWVEDSAGKSFTMDQVQEFIIVLATLGIFQ